MIALIVAFDTKFGIGKNNTIPWHISADLKRFKALTQNSTIIMGRKTWESIGEKPLPKRQNIIVTKTSSNKTLLNNDNVLFVSSIKEAIEKAKYQHIFFIGGSSIYDEAFKYIDTAFVTEVIGDFECDVKFPIENLEKHFIKKEPTDWFEDGNKTIYYRFVEYHKHETTNNLSI